MIAHSAVAAVSDRRRRSEIDATIYVALYRRRTDTFSSLKRTPCRPRVDDGNAGSIKRRFVAGRHAEPAG